MTEVEEIGQPEETNVEAFRPPAKGKLKTSEIKVNELGVLFTSYNEMRAHAAMMAGSGFAIRKAFRDNPGACLALVEDAQRFGMAPYALARTAYMVNDQLAYEAKTVAAIIIGRGPLKRRPKYRFDGEGKELTCTISVETTDGDTITHTSPPLGQISPQNSPLWKTDPQQQLGYYTVRAMARRNFPDLLMGIFDVEEAESRMIDVTPNEPSGLASRLPGTPQDTGFSEEHVVKEMGLKEQLEASIKDIDGMVDKL